jgi:cytochrome c oxidase subunit IV
LIHMGMGNVILPLVLATVQTLLVLLYFMHIRYSEKLNWLMVGAGFVWLAIFVDLILSDYLTRGASWSQ